MKYAGRIGLLLIVVGACVICYVRNEKNYSIWYWREYTVMGKHTTTHTYKGVEYPDYYIEEKYTDEPQYVYSVASSEYQYDSVEKGQMYYKKDSHSDVYNFWFWLVLVMWIGGFIFLTISGANQLMLD